LELELASQQSPQPKYRIALNGEKDSNGLL
jgi:hypothetical protein